MTGRRGPLPRISWHRGGGELAPLASLQAFVEAARRGAELVEVDLRRSADGALVCAHDPVVDGLGAVDRLDWGSEGERAEAEHLAFSFTSFLDALDREDPARACEVHLDVKVPGVEAEAVEAVLKRSRPLLVTSGEESVVASVRRSHPSVAAYLTVGLDGRHLSALDHLRLRVGEVVPFDRVARCGATGIAAHYLLATPLVRRHCTRRGLDLLVWTVDDPRRLARWLARRDVDVVTTNRPLAALAIRAEVAR